MSETPAEPPTPPNYTSLEGEQSIYVQTDNMMASDGSQVYGAMAHTHSFNLNIPGHTHAYSQQWDPPTPTYSEDMELVYRRLGVTEHIKRNDIFDMICVHRNKGHAWCVVALPEKPPVVLETDHDLFPSDQLITQLRLLIEGKDMP